MFESLGPYFFSQVWKEERSGGGEKAPDVALLENYHIELSATGLCMAFSLCMGAHADLFEVAGFPDAYRLDKHQRTKVGSATISMTETRLQVPKDIYRSCKIEQLDFETENPLTRIEAFATMLRRIGTLCTEKKAQHLAMAPTQGSCWFSGLLKPAGFNICDCARPDERDDVGIQLCMAVPAPKTVLPTSVLEDCPMEDPAVGESDKAATADNYDFARRYNRMLKEMATEAKTRELHQVPAEDQNSSSTGTLMRPTKEVRHAQHTGRNDVLASNSSGRPRLVPSAGPTSTATTRQAMIDQIGPIALNSSKTAQSTGPAVEITGLPDARSKKVYCMYWLRKGECDYMQQTCDFKHEMPVDEETRQRIGLREIPSWFRESPEYGQFLQQVSRSGTENSTDVGHHIKGEAKGDRRPDRGVYKPPGAALSTPPRKTKSRPWSPDSDNNDQRAGQGRKRSRKGKDNRHARN